MFVAELRSHLTEVRRLLGSCDPASVSGAEATELVSVFVELERAGSAGKALFARRVEATGAHSVGGFRDAVDWLAQVAGESKGQSLGTLRAARSMDELPALRDAVLSGTVSAAQAKTIAGAAELAPESLGPLLESARTESLKTLSDQADRVRMAASAKDASSRDARAHAGRHLRAWRSPGGGVCGEFSMTDADWGRCLARLESRARVFFEGARREGTHEGHAQYLADALVDLVTGARHEAGDGPGARVLVRVDATALRRGSLGPGEHCEIAGVGTVSVATARSLIGDALFNVVISDGCDVTTVTGTGRTIPSAIRVALAERDRCCVVPGCDAVLGLEIDHWQTEFCLGGKTTLANLARVCKRHHDMHTYRGWRLGGGPGKWRWDRPDPSERVHSTRYGSNRSGSKASNRATSYRATSYRATSYRATSYRATSYRRRSNRATRSFRALPAMVVAIR
jgi:hypothetical protein